ncbi:DUF2252 domain-containing protein [Kitasatospora sp. NBC_00240]|uniref:DUF2252 domain-containing protein n=1 Tax=Kitasatospora sp. NBC_00240 TaxID=2903567 RepID=UPI002258D409|nr:DUF2252 domain-containing protein [Kitasatospora sp. NBC_00240]MCX5213480.1 DUF2252 domain-containing protein [Kitasatospora sp. NBC_00240]
MPDQLTAAHREPERAETILRVFEAAFGELLAQDPAAFRVKFRKMAASAFAFYRGTAGLYYADLTTAPYDGYGAAFLDERTSRVWIHGDLHAENFGSYLNSEGRLVFNVNDFDEAYVGAFTWDVQRLAASLALIGYAKALSDSTITELVRTFAAAYRAQITALVRDGESTSVTLDTATGPILETLRRARLQTRVALLDSETVVDGYDRRFRKGGGAFELDEATKAEVLAAFEAYLTTLPPATRTRPDALRVKDVVGRRGIGIGSAGLPSYNLLLEGHTDALENDVIIYMKQGQTPAVSRHITDPEIRGYFEHEGHRTVISQRALQAHSDPWLGYASLRGQGQLVAEVSPYATDLDWTDLNEQADLHSVIDYLGRATATMHAAADESSSGHTLVPFSTEHAIDAAIGKDEEGFTTMLVDFAHAYGARARQDHQIFVDLFRNGRIPGL